MDSNSPIPPSTNSVAGLILTGGHGLRLGGIRKPELRVGGATLVDRISDAFRPFCDEVFLSIGGDQSDPRMSGRPHLSLIPDDGLGPAEAIVASVEHITSHLPHVSTIIVAPGDCWAIRSEVIGLMMADYSKLRCDIAIGTYGDRDYPLNCLIDAKSFNEKVGAPEEANFENQKGRSARQMYESLRREYISVDRAALQNPFANINDIAELLAAQTAFRARAEKK